LSSIPGEHCRILLPVLCLCAHNGQRLASAMNNLAVMVDRANLRLAIPPEQFRA
jgi:hypothetical protein